MGQEALGRVFNYVEAASGLNINMRDYSGVTFISFLDAGTQNVALQETLPDGTGDQNLAVIDRVYKGPGVGGTWTKVTQAAAATFNLATDATNDCFMFYVGADQLSDGFTCLEATASAGVLHAVLHDPVVQRDAANLPSPIVA